MKKFLIILLTLVITVPAACAKQNKDEIKHEQDKIHYLNIEWWEKYQDPILTTNIKKLYEVNYDLKNTDLKVKENEQIVKVQFANELPNLNFSGSLGRQFRSSNQQFGSLVIPSFAQYNYQLPLTMSYEIDIWGENRLKTKSIEQQLDIVKQAERATYISLTSDFTSDYFNLIKTDKFLEIQNELIKLQTEIVEKTTKKYDTGLCTINEVLAEQKLLTQLKEEKNNLEDKQDTLINSLRVYLSMRDGIPERTSYEKLVLLTNIPMEYDTSVIENRPDYIQEEANIKRMGFDVRIAKKEFLPKFIIYGQIGLNAYDLGKLFNSYSQLFNAGILPSIDLFSGGRKMAFLKLRKLQYEEALNNYQKTILDSIKEINLGLSEYKTAMKNYDESTERLKVQNQIYNLAVSKKNIGAASDIDILYSKEAQLLIEKEQISNKINYLISTISLYKAVGGIDLYKINTQNI